MKEKYNLHTHTVYCDGNNTPEELVKEAIERGFSALGFSGHSNTFDMPISMSHESARIYRRVIGELKEKYKRSIRIYTGVEQDVYETEPTDEYDYVIASVHYLKLDGEYLPIDDTAPRFERLLSLAGGGIALARNYFELVGNTLEYTRAEIIGHFDLLTKFNGDGKYFDENDPDYLKYAADAMEKLRHIPFEVNTGAVSRGYKKCPYPSLTLLKMLRDMGGKVVYSSDCHSKEFLDCAYDDALEYIRAAGFKDFLAFDEIKEWK